MVLLSVVSLIVREVISLAIQLRDRNRFQSRKRYVTDQVSFCPNLNLGPKNG
jgi:hypothetical protein